MLNLTPTQGRVKWRRFAIVAVPAVVVAGGFGQQADSMEIDNLVQHTWLTTAGTFTLPDLRLGFGGSCGQ